MAQAVTTSRDASGNNIPNALREAGYAALIAFGLFVLLIGLKTDQNIRNELILVPRWGLLAIIVAITAIGRFVYIAYAAPYFVASRRAAAQRTVQVAPVEHGFIRRNFNVIGLARAVPLSRVVVIVWRSFGRLPGLAEMGRQFRHPGADLRDARLGPEHRRRARRPARPRLRRLLRRRRLCLCAARHAFRPVVLDPAADRRHHGRLLGRHARLPGAAAARRLSGDRHAGLRRDHPPRADQLARGDQRLGRHLGHPQGHLLRTDVVRRLGRQLHRQGARHRLVGRLLQDIPLLPDRAALPADRLRDGQAAAPADRPRLGGAARGRDRLPLARHQHHHHQADGVCDRRHVRRLRRLVLRRPPGLRQPGILRLPGIGDRACHRRARRHGLARRHRGGGDGDDRRHRDPARDELPQDGVRRELHAGTLPHAAVRPGDRRRHAVEAARLRRQPRADARSCTRENRCRAPSPRKGTADERRHDGKARSSSSSICR